MASTIKNLLNSLIGLKTETLIPILTATVVIMDAAIKYKIKNGKMLLKLTFLLFSLFFSFLVLINAKTSVIGMIANVLVNFTVTALSNVREPRFHIPSQVDAAAVTDDVSFTAVPAKTPNASPDVVSNPTICPNTGKIIAARTLKKNITEIACVTSSSSASITGAVATIAEPPQIDDPHLPE